MRAAIFFLRLYTAVIHVSACSVNFSKAYFTLSDQCFKSSETLRFCITIEKHLDMADFCLSFVGLFELHSLISLENEIQQMVSDNYDDVEIMGNCLFWFNGGSDLRSYFVPVCRCYLLMGVVVQNWLWSLKVHF